MTGKNAAESEPKQRFTVDEANQRLPLVRAIVRDIVDLYQDVHERRERLLQVRHSPGSRTQDEPTPYSEELDQIEQELDRDIDRLDSYVGELRELGVELKDPVVGLVDFPTLIDGREAYLCWKLGEPEVAFWHNSESGFTGRQSLFEDSMASDGTGGLDTQIS